MRAPHAAPDSADENVIASPGSTATASVAPTCGLSVMIVLFPPCIGPGPWSIHDGMPVSVIV